MVTIKEIAKEAGVSPSTVSRVLANKADFYASATAERVKAVAKEMGYKKNQAAVELVQQRSNVIAAVVSAVKTNFASDMLDGIQQQANAYGYRLIVSYAGSADPVEQRQALLTVIERPVMGILLLSVALSEDNLTLLKSARIPYCFLSMSFDDQRPFISSDDHEIGYQATKYLLAAGHRKIGLAGLDQYPYTGRRRLEGYRQALMEADIVPEKAWLQIGDYSFQSGLAAMKAYGANTTITGVVAASDMVAVGLLNQARRLGKRVPDDLSIVSIDGTEMCEIVQPALTSVTQDFYQMGIDGVQRIHQMEVAKQPVNGVQAFVPVVITERESVKELR